MTAAAEAKRLNKEEFAAFAERAADGKAIGHLRTEALTRGELHPVDPGEGVPQ
jgi:hypothetical protein